MIVICEVAKRRKQIAVGIEHREMYQIFSALLLDFEGLEWGTKKIEG